MNLLTKILGFSALAAMATSVIAAPKPNVYDGGNRWLITAYNDASANHNQMATQGLCFLPYAQVGTHIRGRWYSDTFPNWNGIYSQEGDQVTLHGDYANNVGHDGIQFELTTNSRRDRGMGHWTEWRENSGYGNTVVFANTELKRAGKCHRIPSLSAVTGLKSGEALEYIQVPYRQLESGGIAQDPLQAGQLEIESTKESPQLELIK